MALDVGATGIAGAAANVAVMPTGLTAVGLSDEGAWSIGGNRLAQHRSGSQIRNVLSAAT